MPRRALRGGRVLATSAQHRFVQGADTMGDPELQLYSESTVIARNDGWQTTDPLCAAPALNCGTAAQSSRRAWTRASRFPGIPV